MVIILQNKIGQFVRLYLNALSFIINTIRDMYGLINLFLVVSLGHVGH